MASEFIGIHQSDLPDQSMGINRPRCSDFEFEIVGNLKSVMLFQGQIWAFEYSKTSLSISIDEATERNNGEIGLLMPLVSLKHYACFLQHTYTSIGAKDKLSKSIGTPSLLRRLCFNASIIYLGSIEGPLWSPWSTRKLIRMDNLEWNSPKPLAGQGTSGYQERNRFLLSYIAYHKDTESRLS